jgi:flagellar biosynthetic protein FliO
MKVFLPVFLALCLCAAPVFSQDAHVSDAAAVLEAESAEAAGAEAEHQGIFAPPPAQDINSATAVVAEEASLFGNDVPQFSILRAFGGLGIVLCLLVGAYMGIRKLAPGYFPAKASDGTNLKIVESLGMGDRRSIALVEVGGKRFLIGSTPQQINLLTTLPEHISLVAEDHELKELENTKEERQAFRNMFEFRKKRSGKQPGNVLSDEVLNKMRRLRESLENR